MKLLYKQHRLHIQAMVVVVLILSASITCISCDSEELEIQQNYPFEIKLMPVPKEIAVGQTVEIRITIERSGDFSDTRYYLRYFQFDGTGTLRYYDEPSYLPNDLYPLRKTQFRLYYTSTSTVSQSLEVWISDSFGNEKQLSFEFNSSD